jgi:ABC-2 type transport system ATP-binding protein
MSIDAKLLVLDEPTLGLDILFRKQFYDSLLNDYFDHHRTILVTTHQIDEIQYILTDLLFIDRGNLVFGCSMDDFDTRYLELLANPAHLEAARALKPIRERQTFGRTILLYDRVPREQLAPLGDLRTPTIADVFVAFVGQPNQQPIPPFSQPLTPMPSSTTGAAQ